MTLLIVLISVSAVLYSIADTLKKEKLRYLFKPLTTVFVIILAFIQPTDGFTNYKILMIVALSFSLLGDIFLMLPNDKFVQGLASFLIAHLFFIVAFGLDFGPFLDFSYLLPSLIYGVVFLWILLPKTGKLKPAVFVYAFILIVFLWQASGNFFYLANETSLYILLGAILFVISDSILAYSKFVRNYILSPSLIHLTYWGAQTLLALSI